MEKNLKILFCKVNKINENWIYISTILLCIVLSYFCCNLWVANNVIVHTALETICIFIGFSIFIISWQMLDKSLNVSRIIAFGFLIVTIFDIFHTMYFHIGFLDYLYCREITCKFWILGRLTGASVLLLVSLKLPSYHINKYKQLLISIFAAAFAVAIVFMFPYQWRFWTINGLTPLKITMECLIILLLIISLIFLNNENKSNHPFNLKYVRFAIISAIAAEFCFTLYQNNTLSFYSLLGHMVRVICSIYLFSGVYWETAQYPYNEAVNKLNLSESLFESVFENSPNGVAVISISGKWMKNNRQFTKLFGNTNIKEQSYTQLFYGEQQEMFYQHVKELINCQKPYIKFKKKYINQFGEEKWIFITKSLVRDSKEKPLFLVSQIEDITDHLAKDNIIKKQNQQLETIIENMSDWLITLDKYGNILKANKAMRENINNFSEFKNIGDFFDNVEVYDCIGRVFSDNEDFKKILKGENIKGLQYTVKTGNRAASFDINCTTVYDKEDINAIVIIGHDVTHRLKNEEALLIKTQFNIMNSIIDRLELGFVRFTYPDYKIMDINHKYYDTMKQANPEIGPFNSIAGKKMNNLHPFGNKDEMASNIKKMIDKKISSYYTYKSIKIGDANKYYKLLHQPIYGLNKKVMEEVIISIDITEEIESRKKMEENLKMQEDIFANISHELKTPLNVIFCTNQLTEFYLNNGFIKDDHSKISKSINVVKQNCYRFTKIINNVVDLSKMESGFYKLNLSNENIIQLVEDIVQSVSEYIDHKHMDIIFDTDVEERYIACDPDKIERIILNLISNAIKFTNPGGKIFVNIFDEEDNVEIWVRDTGIGMDAKHLKDIFKRFHQVDKSLSRNAEGSGIGLSLVKTIVELHKGKIWAESKPGEGSTFKIKLPAISLLEADASENIKAINSKVEKINIEFSDIYSVQ